MGPQAPLLQRRRACCTRCCLEEFVWLFWDRKLAFNTPKQKLVLYSQRQCQEHGWCVLGAQAVC